MRVLSAFNSFFGLRDMCRNAARLSPADRARHNDAAANPSSSSARRASASGRIGMGGRRASFPGLYCRQGTAGSRSGERVGRAGGLYSSILDESEDGKTSNVDVPANSLASLLVHADQRRNPLRMIHFAEVIPPPPPPPPLEYYGTPSPRMPRGDPGVRRAGKGQGAEPPPPSAPRTDTRNPRRSSNSCRSSVQEPTARGVEREDFQDENVGDDDTARSTSDSVCPLCITCGELPVIRIVPSRQEDDRGWRRDPDNDDDVDDEGYLGSGSVSSGGGGSSSGGVKTRKASSIESHEHSDDSAERLKEPNMQVDEGVHLQDFGNIYLTERHTVVYTKVTPAIALTLWSTLKGGSILKVACHVAERKKYERAVIGRARDTAALSRTTREAVATAACSIPLLGL